VLFLDEIHRFNKAQQDALLPAVEEGLLTLIGATTENPYFEVNSALLSRCQVYELQPLDVAQVEELLRRALSDPERGLADPPPVEDAALAMLAARSGGDARVALAGLERAVERASDFDPSPGGSKSEAIDVAAIEDALQRKALDYDRQGDRHYDFVSAWIKATRGSDVDASLYYLAVMLEGGEDPRFIVRRMVILASEDVGNADPQALLVADAAARAVDRVGLPECALNLAQATVYLALAPKSNASYKGLEAARAEVRTNGAKTPPDYLRDAHYPGAKSLGRGEGYRYAHDEPGGVSDQQLLPEGLEERRFYSPTDRGFEADLGRRLDAAKKRSSALIPPQRAEDCRNFPGG
jgi:putative ATPase